MRIIQEETKRPVNGKITDRLCGRLIVWDVGTRQERLVRLEENYRDLQYELSAQIELKPYVDDRRAVRKSSSSLKPLAKRFYERNGYSHKDLYKKQHST